MTVAAWAATQSASAWGRLSIRDGEKGEVMADYLTQRVWVWDGEAPSASRWQISWYDGNLDGRNSSRPVQCQAQGVLAPSGGNAGSAPFRRAVLPGGQGRLRDGRVSGPPLAGVAPSHGPGHDRDHVPGQGATFIARRPNFSPAATWWRSCAIGCPPRSSPTKTSRHPSSIGIDGGTKPWNLPIECKLPCYQHQIERQSDSRSKPWRSSHPAI